MNGNIYINIPIFMYNLVKKRLRRVLENLQQADKVYFNTGKLSSEAREMILNITGGDNYTKLVADLAFHLLKHGDIFRDQRLFQVFYEYLETYDKSVFPIVGNLTDYGIDKSNDFHVFNLFALLQHRSYAVSALRKLPSIVVRNIRDTIRIPQKNEYAFDEITKKLNELARLIKVIPDTEKTRGVRDKIFTSKNGLDGMIAVAKQFEHKFTAGEAIPKDETIYLAHHNGSDIIQDTDEILVVRVNSQDAMQELSCTSLWCFSRPDSKDFWYQYAPDGFVYLIFDFTKDYDEAVFMLVYLPDSGTVYASTNVPLEDVGINMQGSEYLESIGVIMNNIYTDSQDLSRGERMPPEEEDNYELDETIHIVKKLLREKLNNLGWFKQYEQQLTSQGFEAEFNPVNDKLVTIEIIGVPKDKHGQGHGSQIMNNLCNKADELDVVLQLRPAASSTHSRGKLIKFYSKFGFIENKGSNKDENYQYMYRLPK